MTIAEASRHYGVSADTLRYYERVGVLPPVPRTKGGFRDYDEESCRWIELMLCMRSAGVQIEALAQYVRLSRQGEETAEARRELLVKQRDQLLERLKEMQQSLDRLNYKIDWYDRKLAGQEQ